MAGIGFAKQLVQDNKNRGKVIATGRTVNNEKYILVQLEGDKGRIHQIDHGGDIRLEPSIGLNDIVELSIVDEYSAIWKTVENGGVQIE